MKGGFFVGDYMNVSDVFKAVSSDAKGQFVAPTEGGTEWNQWLSWLNEELDGFGEVHDWPELINRSYPILSSQSGTSTALPSNFKKFAGNLVLNLGSASPTFYNEVDGDQFDKYTNTSKVFSYGYDSGWFAEWKGALTSAASGFVPIVHYHTALASANDTIHVRNPRYLVKRLKLRVYKYRKDPIFTEIESEADLMLQQMIENEYYKHSQYKGGATTREEEAGFTLGLD